MKFKPALNFILAVALIISLSVPTFATQVEECMSPISSANEAVDTLQTRSSDIEPCIICGFYDWTPISGSFVPNKYVKRTATGCTKYVKTTYQCNRCDSTTTNTEPASTSTDHIPSIYDATCNGTTQTLYKRCYTCRYDLGTSPQTCPGGPHSGNCSYLPA